MDNNCSEIQIKLHKMAKQKGYLTFDNIIDLCDKYEMGLDDIDRISEEIMSSGIIIKENEDPVKSGKISKTENSDRSKLDYKKIYKRVLELDESLRPYIKFVIKTPPPANRELKSIIYQAKEGNQYAIDRIVYMYSKIVIKIALNFTDRYKLPIADTIQEGTIGLINAIEKYDPNGEALFSTYAPWWIRQNIQRSANVINPQIYYPVHIKDKLFSIYDLVLGHICENCKKDDYCPWLINKVCERLECDNLRAMWYIGQLQELDSIEQIVEDNEERFNDNQMFEQNMIDCINHSIKQANIEHVLQTLTERECDVLCKRFGFINDCEMTLEEIGKGYNVSRERIRQIEEKALRKMRHPSRSKWLK